MRSPGAGAAQAKTAHATLWVSNPTRKAEPATGSESCVAGRKAPARSVDSQCESPAIEPRNEGVEGAFAVRSARATPKHRYGQVLGRLRGPRTEQTHLGSTGNMGSPKRPCQDTGSGGRTPKTTPDSVQAEQSAPASELRTSGLTTGYVTQFANNGKRHKQVRVS